VKKKNAKLYFENSVHMDLKCMIMSMKEVHSSIPNDEA
jgi:hypothetical protein